MENEELLAEVKALRSELDELKDLVHEGIIKPIEQDYNDRKYKEATDIWTERYKDKLSPFEARVKAMEGDDFDLYKSTYDAWNETDADSDEWVDMFIKELNESLQPLADAFGVPVEDLNAEIKIEDGEVAEVTADTEPEVAEVEVTEGEGEEEKAEDKEEEKELSEEEQFQKELDEAYEKMKGKR